MGDLLTPRANDGNIGVEDDDNDEWVNKILK